MCPIGSGWLTGARGMCCHCLLIESDDGLVLVDTGLGTADLAEPGRRLGRVFTAGMGLDRDPAQTARAQVERLGFKVEDVRHLILTHLDLDHAGGLSDFPRARVHLTVAEHDAALARATTVERMRYRLEQWAHGPEWSPHAPVGEEWHGFAAVSPIEGLREQVLMVPVSGHTRGHAAVAVRDGAGWLLHCGDAYFHHDELGADGRKCPRGLDLFQKWIAMDRTAWAANQARLRELALGADGEVRLFCAHDPHELFGFDPAAVPARIARG